MMMTVVCRNSLLVVFISACFLQCSFAQNTCPTVLLNSVVYEGNPFSFLRDPRDSASAQWLVAPSSLNNGDSLRNITTDFNYTPNLDFTGAYAVNNSQLTILKSTVAPEGSISIATAGIYLLNFEGAMSDCSRAANLLVLRSEPQCTCDGSDPNNVKLNCDVVFANYQNLLQPVITWKDGSGGVVLEDRDPDTVASIDTDNLPGLQKKTSQLLIFSNNPATYRCQLTFDGPPFESPPNIAMNAPDFVAPCSISIASTTMTTETTTATTTNPPSTTTTTSSTSEITSTISTATTATSTEHSSTTTAYTATAAQSTTASTTPALETSAPTASHSTFASSEPSTATPSPPSTAEPLSTTTAPASEAASLTSTASVDAPASLPTTESSSESESQAVIILIVLAVVAVSALTLVILTWAFCSCQSVSTQAGTQMAKPMISGVNALSYPSPRGNFEGRQRFEQRRTFSYQV